MKLTKKIPILVALVILLTFPQTVRAERFNDLGDSPYREQIEKWAEMGVLFGVDGIHFEPNEPLTRAELSALVARVFRLRPTGLSRFADVSPADWFCADAAACAEYGLLPWEGKLNPNEPVLWQTFINVFGNALCGKESKSANTGVISRAEAALWLDSHIRGIAVTNATGHVDGCALVVGAADIRDAQVDGDLVITEAVSGQTVTLYNTKVRGRVILRGGANLVMAGRSTAGGVTFLCGQSTFNADDSVSINEIRVLSGASAEIRGKVERIEAEQNAFVSLANEMDYDVKGYSYKTIYVHHSIQQRDSDDSRDSESTTLEPPKQRAAEARAIESPKPLSKYTRLSGTVKSDDSALRHALVTLTQASGKTLTQRTTANGVFNFQNVSADNGTITLSVSKVGFIDHTESLPTDFSSDTLERAITLTRIPEGNSTVRGYVTLRENTKSKVISVKLKSGTTTYAHTAAFATDDKPNEFVMDFIPPGTYTLVVSADGYDVLNKTGIIINENELIGVDVTLDVQTDLGDYRASR